MSKKKKVDFTEYKSAICKTSWINIFEPNAKDLQKLREAGKDESKYRRKCTFMFPKTIASIELKISDEAKKKMLKASNAFLKEYKAAALKMALSVWDDCETEADLDAEEIRWNPILDGDSRKMIKTYAGNAGYYIVRAGTGFSYADAEKMPFVYTPDNERVLESGVLKSGDWVRGFLTLFTYHGETEGVTAGMNNIKKCYKGTFSGVATKEFDDDEELEELEAAPEDFDKEVKEDEGEEEPWN